MELTNPLDWNSQILFDDISESLILLNELGQIVTLNKAAELTLGVELPAVRQRALAELFQYISFQYCQQVSMDELPFVFTQQTGKITEKSIIGIKISPEKTLWCSMVSKPAVHYKGCSVLVCLNDVTDLVVQNRRLKVTEQNLSRLLASMDDIVFEVTHLGQILNCWTNKPEQLFFPAEYIRGKNLSELFPPQAADQFSSMILHTYQTKQANSLEYASPFDDSRENWYKLTTRPVHSSEDKVAVVISDITEHRKLTNYVNDLDLRWQFVLENSDQLLCDWDLTTNKVSVDGSIAKALGFNTEPVDMAEIKERIHPEDLPKFIRQYYECMSGQQRYMELDYRVSQLDGNFMWIHSKSVVAASNAGGAPARMLGIGNDITEWMDMLADVRLNEEKFNRAFQDSSIGMALVSLDGKFMDVNKTLCKILGYKPNELVRLTSRQLIHPHDIPSFKEHFEKLAGNEMESYTAEKRFRHQSGHYVWSSLTVSTVIGPGSKPIFCIAQIQDISLLKQQVNALERQKAEQELTMNHLVSSLRQMEDFNQIVAHNLRAPAANVAMLTDQIKLITEPIERESYLDLLQMSSHELINILQDLMNVLEIRDNPSVKFEDCIFDDLLSKVKNQFLSDILSKRARITTSFDVALMYYPKIYLESILSNLLSNSLKYTHPDTTPHIHLQTRLLDGQICLVFTDNGLGIDLDRHGKHIFKFKKTFHPGFESKGIGLFMVRQQIERFGGTIQVESKPGHGAKFTILLNQKK